MDSRLCVCAAFEVKKKKLQIIKIEKALDLIDNMCYNKILTESIVSMI